MTGAGEGRKQEGPPQVGEPPVERGRCGIDRDGEEGTGQEGPTAQGKEVPAPPRAVAEPDGGAEREKPPLVEEPPGQERDYGGGEVAGGERGGDRWGKSAGRLPVGRRATFESTNPQQQGRDACRRRVTRHQELRREQRGGRAVGLAAKAIWGWILLALGLWGVLQVGATLVLKGSRERVEVFAFDALRQLVRPGPPFRASSLR